MIFDKNMPVKKTPMMKWDCPRCGGYGYVEFEDSDGRLCQDACYHCWNTGYVSYNPYPLTEDEVNEELQLIANEEDTDTEFDLTSVIDALNDEVRDLTIELDRARKERDAALAEVDRLEWENKGIGEWRELCLIFRSDVKTLRALLADVQGWFEGKGTTFELQKRINDVLKENKE